MSLMGLAATGICSMMGAGITVIPFMIQRNVPGIGPYVLPAYLFALRSLPLGLQALHQTEERPAVAQLRPRTFCTRGVAIATLRNCITISMEPATSIRAVRTADMPWHADFPPST